MDNTWYYTLSTIAQTLAAVLGLVVVFATVRLNNIIDELKKYRKIAHFIAKIVDKHQSIDYERKIADITAHGLLDILKKIKKDYPEKYEKNSGIPSDLEKLAQNLYPDLKLDGLNLIEDTIYHLNLYIKQREGLAEALKVPGIATASTIIYAIFLLSVSNLLYCFTSILFALAVIFSILSIYLIVKASWKLFEDSIEKY